MGVRAAPTMSMGSFSMADSDLVRWRPRADSTRRRVDRARGATRARDELAAAIRAASAHRVGARRAERAFVAADARIRGIGGQRCGALFARRFQRERHVIWSG